MRDDVLESLFVYEDATNRVNYFRQRQDDLEVRDDVQELEATNVMSSLRHSLRTYYQAEWEISKLALTAKKLKEILEEFPQLNRNQILDFHYQSFDLSLPPSLPSDNGIKPLSVFGWWMVPVTIKTGINANENDLMTYINSLISSMSSYVIDKVSKNNLISNVVDESEAAMFSVFSNPLDVYKAYKARLPQSALKKNHNLKNFFFETYPEQTVQSFLIPVTVMASTPEAIFATRDVIKEAFDDYVDEKIALDIGVYVGSLQSKTAAVWTAHEQAWNCILKDFAQKIDLSTLYHFNLNVYRRKGEAVELKVVLNTTLADGKEYSKDIFSSPVEDTEMLSSILNDFAHLSLLNISWSVSNLEVSSSSNQVFKSPLSMIE